jgi:hypothetical protein
VRIVTEKSNVFLSSFTYFLALFLWYSAKHGKRVKSMQSSSRRTNLARNGSGTMEVLNNSWSPPINGNLATSGDWQAIYLDLVAALTQSLSRDG